MMMKEANGDILGRMWSQKEKRHEENLFKKQRLTNLYEIVKGTNKDIT